MAAAGDRSVPPHQLQREDSSFLPDGLPSNFSSLSSFSAASTVASSTGSSLWSRRFSFGKRVPSPRPQYAIRGAPGENSELLSFPSDPQLPGGRREGGLRFAELGEQTVPGRLVFPGNRQLYIVRRESGDSWDLVRGRGSSAPLAQAKKVPGRRRFVLRLFREVGGALSEFVLDGEARGRKVHVYDRGETCKNGEKEAPVATILWSHFRRGDDVRNGGVVRLDQSMEGDTFLFCVWLAMLLWRKRPVGGRNECLDSDELPERVRRAGCSLLNLP